MGSLPLAALVPVKQYARPCIAFLPLHEHPRLMFERGAVDLGEVDARRAGRAAWRGAFADTLPASWGKLVK